MPAHLLDDALVEVSRISKKAPGDIISVLEPAESSERHLGPFEEISLGSLHLEMLILHPVVMC